MIHAVTSGTDDTPLIRVSAVVVRDGRGRVLTVRKRGTTRFMLPGGKPEPGESAAQTAARELAEELGVEVDPAALRPLGTFRAPAANEAGHDVEGAVFAHEEIDPPGVAAAAEIEELRWLDLASPLPDDLAPLLEHRVVPALTP
jgi:8-oxo-dGTP pyrophosphatase MutT (NUDIX family)